MARLRRAQPLIFALILTVLGCASPAATQTTPVDVRYEPSSSSSATPKRMTAAIQSDPAVLSAKIRLLGVGIAGVDALEELVAAGLVNADLNGTLHPQLAEAVPSLENGGWKLFPDGRMETTWQVRTGAKWHDGTPVTSEDLVFTAEVVQDREVRVFREAAYDFIESVTAPDPRTVTVTWKKPYINADLMFTYDLALPLPKHLLERSFTGERADRANFAQSTYWTEEYVGTGPYRVKEWVRGSHMALSANPDYVLGRPKIDEIEVRFIPAAPVLAANLLAGTAELTLGRSLSLEQALQVRDQWREGSMYTGFSSTLLIYPQFINPSPAVIGDVRFRRALLHAIDRQEMADTLQAGLVPVAHNFLGPSARESKEVEGSVVRTPYDPRRATQLIEELGYVRAADGAVRDSAGQRLSVEIRTSQGDDLQEKTLFGAADYWQRVGVGVETMLVTPQQAEGREFRAVFPSFDVKRQPDDLTFLERIHGSKTPLPENNFLGNNYSRYMNPTLDTAIDRFFATIPTAERLDVLRQIVGHVTERVTVMSLFYNTSPSLVSNRLQNVVQQKDGRVLRPWNAHEWDLR
jgi:peptide/nickel transport system substrate-binding protein